MACGGAGGSSPCPVICRMRLRKSERLGRGAAGAGPRPGRWGLAEPCVEDRLEASAAFFIKPPIIQIRMMRKKTISPDPLAIYGVANNWIIACVLQRAVVQWVSPFLGRCAAKARRYFDGSAGWPGVVGPVPAMESRMEVSAWMLRS